MSVDKGDPRRPEARKDMPLLNERIRDRELRVIDEDGTQLGIVPTREALTTAKEKGLDLFVVQPDANPPVAKIMDYGRHKFEQEKKNRETKIMGENTEKNTLTTCLGIYARSRN